MPTLTKTRSELVLRALSLLGVIAENRPAYPNEIDTIDDDIDGCLRDLAIRGVIYIGNVEETPVEAFEPLAKILADRSAPYFGTDGLASEANGESARDRAERDLAVLGYGRPSYQPLAIDYF